MRLLALATIVLLSAASLESQTATAPATQPTAGRSHGHIELFCQHLQADGSEKNSVSFTIAEGFQSATFGQVRNVRLTCLFVGQRDGADIYEASSQPNVETPPPAETTIVNFRGSPVILFEDAAQRVTLRARTPS